MSPTKITHKWNSRTASCLFTMPVNPSKNFLANNQNFLRSNIVLLSLHFLGIYDNWERGFENVAEIHEANDTLLLQNQ